MSDPFAAAGEAFESSQSTHESPASTETNTDPSSSEQAPRAQWPDSNQINASGETSVKKEVDQAIAELDKMEKFKLDGQEWTLKDLKAAIMRQKDYTQKTQAIAQERKTFEESKKFDDNLKVDLASVRSNPSLVAEFVRVYPERYHHLVEDALKNQPAAQATTQQQVSTQPQVDVQLYSRLQHLEKVLNDQEVAKAEASIKTTMDELAKKYPETENKLARETILARAHELYNGQNQELSKDAWDQIYKEVAEEVKEFAKAQYGTLVKKQTEANSKARDVGAGGGIVGSAPRKFKNFDEITKFAESEALRG